MKRLDGVLGDQLLQLVSGASCYLFLAAPFVKRAVITRLLDVVRPGISGVVLTRWRPEEVAAGVSDLEVLDVINRYPGWELFLCHQLHAKYYRADDRVVVGSANLTEAALSWRSPANVELLIEISNDGQEFAKFERDLIARSLPATPEIRDAVSKAAAVLAASMQQCTAPVQASFNEGDFVKWLPHARNPSDVCYAIEGGLEQLSTAAREQIAADLIALDLPGIHPKKTAELLIRSRLQQHPLVFRITEYCLEPRRFGEVREVIDQWIRQQVLNRDADEAWQTMMRWLLYFFPERYSVSRPHITELFRTIVNPKLVEK